MMIEVERVKAFFQDVVAMTGIHQDVFLVMVTHFVNDRYLFIDALSQIAEVGLLIPKPNSIIPEVEAQLSKKYRVLRTTRSEIADNPEQIIIAIDRLRKKKRVIILDIGGYFAAIASSLKEHFKDDLIGIIEDTENGHQKYFDSEAYNLLPVYSVARSPLKNTEDFLVGLSICFSAEAVLREINEIFTGRRALVLGYGKIGYSIAKHLAERNIRVYVYDTNPLRLIEAKSHGHIVLTKEDSLKVADIVFCATGKKSIVGTDIYLLKNDCVIFTATSSDDELSLSDRVSDFERVERISGNITSLTTKKGNRYHLCNGGNAVNFLHGASVGPFIFLVQSEILFSVKSLSEHSGELGKIWENKSDDQKSIAAAWLKGFASDK